MEIHEKRSTQTQGLQRNIGCRPEQLGQGKSRLLQWVYRPPLREVLKPRARIVDEADILFRNGLDRYAQHRIVHEIRRSVRSQDGFLLLEAIHPPVASAATLPIAGRVGDVPKVRDDPAGGVNQAFDREDKAVVRFHGESFDRRPRLHGCA
ncbi:MAG: hypothetical protein Kow00122_00450 [Thermoleophilia bacterium]